MTPEREEVRLARVEYDDGVDCHRAVFGEYKGMWWDAESPAFDDAAAINAAVSLLLAEQNKPLASVADRAQRIVERWDCECDQETGSGAQYCAKCCVVWLIKEIRALAPKGE